VLKADRSEVGPTLTPAIAHQPAMAFGVDNESIDTVRNGADESELDCIGVRRAQLRSFLVGEEGGDPGCCADTGLRRASDLGASTRADQRPEVPRLATKGRNASPDPVFRGQGSHNEVMVELVGALSNSEVQDQIGRLAEKLEQIAASGARPRSSARSDRRLRSGLVPKAIMRVLSESVEPLRMKDIHAEVERDLGQPVSRSAVKNWLARHAGGEQPLFVRLARGRYGLASQIAP